MSLKQKAQHLSAVAQWKASQQVRIMNIKGKITDCDNQIRANKSQLADTALTLFFKNELKNQELIDLGTNVDLLKKKIENLLIEKENVKNEQPPDSNFGFDIPSENLVCPECYQSLKGKFCPVHGVEGVPSNTVAAGADASAGLQCPECKKPLVGSFCPDCGLPGVPVSVIEPS